MIVFERDSNLCAHCGTILDERFDEITVRNSTTYHTECLEENLKQPEDTKTNKGDSTVDEVKDGEQYLWDVQSNGERQSRNENSPDKVRVLNNREIATIIAALRKFQRNPDPNMEHFEEGAPLSNEEIDDLCQRLN